MSTYLEGKYNAQLYNSDNIRKNNRVLERYTKSLYKWGFVLRGILLEELKKCWILFLASNSDLDIAAMRLYAENQLPGLLKM